MDFDFEVIEPYLDFIKGIENEITRKNEYFGLIYAIGRYQKLKKNWEELKDSGYQKEKKTLQREYAAALKKQIDITRKFLIRLDHPMPLVEHIPTIPPVARAEVILYLHRLESINSNEEINARFHGEMPTKRSIDVHIRDIFKTYNLVGVEDAVRELLPLI